MIRYTFPIVAILMATTPRVALTEEISGPPAIFALESHDNLDGDTLELPFMEMGDLTTEEVSETSAVSATTPRELLPEEDFVASIRFVNKRSNRLYDVDFNTTELSSDLEADVLLKAMQQASAAEGEVVASDDGEVGETVSQQAGEESQKLLDLPGVAFKDFQLNITKCLKDYNNIHGNDMAFVSLMNRESSALLFEGWVYKKRPSVHVFQHPVYAFHLISCKPL